MRARRIECRAQLRLGAAQFGIAGGALHRAERAIKLVAVRSEHVGDQIQDRGALIEVGGAVDCCNPLGAGARRKLAAALCAVVFEQLLELRQQARPGAVGLALAVSGQHRSGEPAPPIAYPLECGERGHVVGGAFH